MGLTRAKSRRTGEGGAFTLVELLVGVIVCAMVAGAVAASVGQLARLRTTSAARRQAYARADAAASRIAQDALAACRHHALMFARVQVIDAPGGQPFDELLLLSRAVRPVRGGDESPEGGEYEVQFRVVPTPSLASGIALWRRVDPAFDPAIDAGGVADAAVAGVTALSIQASDGASWFDAWDSDNDGIPHGLRVNITAASDDGRVTAVARRVIPFDSVPIPPETADEADTASPSSSAPVPASSTGGGR